MANILFTEDFVFDPQSNPVEHGVVSGSNTASAWQPNDQILTLQPGTNWRSPAFSVQPLSYVRLSFRAKLTTASPPAPITKFNRNNISFRSINPLATWNLDPANLGPSGGDLIANHYTAPINISEIWNQQVFYSRAQANATQMAIKLEAIEAPLSIDDISVEVAENLQDIALWAEQTWNNRPRDASLSTSPSISVATSTEQRLRLERTISRLRAGQQVKIVLVGDSIVNDLSNSGFESLLQQEFPGSRISVITAVGGGTGMDQWNPQNATYPFINSDKYRGALDFNEAIIEQEPDLIILGGISTPANSSGYAAFQAIIDKIHSPSALARIGHRPDILITTGAFGYQQLNWYSSSELNATRNDYRGNLLRIANQNNAGYLDLAGAWGSYIMAASNASDSSAIKSETSLEWYWRDSVHANSLGKLWITRQIHATMTV